MEEEYAFFKPQILESYYLTGIVGRGAYGVVYRCIDLESGEEYALKTVQAGKMSEAAFLSEVEANKRLSPGSKCDKYVVCIYGYGFHNAADPIPAEILEKARQLGLESQEKFSKSVYFIVQELMQGDLIDIIEMPKKDTMWAETPALALLWIMERCIGGLSVIHEKDMAHQDIKPSNILFKTLQCAATSTDGAPNIKDCLLNPLCTVLNLRVKYGDLGFVCGEDVPRVKSCDAEGTILYLSPDLIKNIENIDLEIAQDSDKWSLGVTLWAFAFGEHPYFEDDVGYGKAVSFLSTLDQKSFDKKVPMNYHSGNKELDEGINYVLSQLLRVDPAERPDMFDLKQIVDEKYLLPSLKNLPSLLIED